MLATGTFRFRILLLTCMAVFFVVGPQQALAETSWSATELATLRSLALENLPARPEDPSNRFASSQKAAQFGKMLFFDTRLSANGEVACFTCHRPDYSFTDDLPMAQGMSTTPRRSMPLLGMAYQDWYFWDGHKDSLWAQALAPPENPLEHGFSRTACVLLVYEHYRKDYKAIFGPLPKMNPGECSPLARPDPQDPVAYAAWMAMPEEKRAAITSIYVNLGKAIAAYVRTLTPTEARFDRYVASIDAEGQPAEEIFSPAEEHGLKLFIGKAGCINCHNGPLLTNGDFHPTIVPDATDLGRATGIPKVLNDEFSCLSRHSDADPETDCAHVRFINDDTSLFRHAFKTPSLRNVAARPPYMHAGQFKTLDEVLKAYRFASQKGELADMVHGNLADSELAQLEAFLQTLNAPIVEIP